MVTYFKKCTALKSLQDVTFHGRQDPMNISNKSHFNEDKIP